MRLFRRTEDRASETTSYSDALVDLIIARASGDIAKFSATAALETCAGIVQRAFAAAEVQGPPMVAAALDGRTRSMIGRALIRKGEIVFHGKAGDGLVLRPASAWTITGENNPESWTYLVHLAGPSRQTSLTVGSGDVFHFMYSSDPARPWHGVGPLEAASLAGRLSAELAAALSDEAAGTRGFLLPIPSDGQDATVTALRADLGSLRGKTALVESQTLGQWTPGERQSVAGSGWSPVRLGASPPAPLVELAVHATREVMEACGISPGLFSESGTVSREAWRQTLHGVIAPLGQLAAEEISMKTGTEVRFTWSELRASDIMSKARAVQSLTGAGATLESAAAATGLEGLQEAPVEPPREDQGAPVGSSQPGAPSAT